jgi:hypothetical protein
VPRLLDYYNIVRSTKTLGSEGVRYTGERIGPKQRRTQTRKRETKILDSMYFLEAKVIIRERRLQERDPRRGGKGEVGEVGETNAVGWLPGGRRSKAPARHSLQPTC